MSATACSLKARISEWIMSALPWTQNALEILKSRLEASIKATPLCIAIAGWIADVHTELSVADIRRSAEGDVLLRLSDEETVETLSTFFEFLNQVKVICQLLALNEVQTATDKNGWSKGERRGTADNKKSGKLVLLASVRFSERKYSISHQHPYVKLQFLVPQTRTRSGLSHLTILNCADRPTIVCDQCKNRALLFYNYLTIFISDHLIFCSPPVFIR